MKNAFGLRYCFSYFLLISIIGCKSEYESKLIGKYSINEFEYLKSKVKLDSSYLTLYSNKSFQIQMTNHKNIVGKWDSGDDGDRAWIKFRFQEKDSFGTLGGDSLNYISINNPAEFGYPYLKALTYKKLK